MLPGLVNPIQEVKITMLQPPSLIITQDACTSIITPGCVRVFVRLCISVKNGSGSHMHALPDAPLTCGHRSKYHVSVKVRDDAIASSSSQFYEAR